MPQEAGENPRRRGRHVAGGTCCVAAISYMSRNPGVAVADGRIGPICDERPGIGLGNGCVLRQLFFVSDSQRLIA